MYILAAGGTFANYLPLCYQQLATWRRNWLEMVVHLENISAEPYNKLNTDYCNDLLHT